MENDLTSNEQDYSYEEIKDGLWHRIITPLTDLQRQIFQDEYLSQGFKLPNDNFNEFNLRYDIDYLNSVGGSACMLPLEFMAYYVDGICKESIDTQEGVMEESLLEDDISDESFTSMTATALGNMAYIILSTKNEKVKNTCLDSLRKYFDFYFDKILFEQNEKSKKDNTIN